MRCGAVRGTITCGEMWLCHFANGCGAIFAVYAVYAVWWIPLIVTTHSNYVDIVDFGGEQNHEGMSFKADNIYTVRARFFVMVLERCPS